MKLTNQVGAVVIALLLGTAAVSSAQILPGGGGSCVTCVNVDEHGQDCVETSATGPGTGASCIIFYEDGFRWCNWQGACNSGFSALDLRAAGTFAAAATLTRTDGTTISQCGGFVVSYRHGTSELYEGSVAGAPRMPSLESAPSHIQI